MKYYSLIVIIAFLTLSGCKTTDINKPLSGEEAKAFSENGPEPEMGVLVGSFSFYGKHPSAMAKLLGGKNFKYNRYGFFFRGIDELNSEETGDIGESGSFLSNKYEMEFKLEEGGGYVFAIPLPPGKYEFFQYHFFQNAAYIQNYWSAKEEFSLTFEIIEGEATYIGEVRAIHRWANGLMGYMPGGGYFAFSEQEERDLPLLKNKFKFLKDYTITSSPLIDFEELLSEPVAGGDRTR